MILRLQNKAWTAHWPPELSMGGGSGANLGPIIALYFIGNFTGFKAGGGYRGCAVLVRA